jgi:hypothetical protein
VSETHGTGRGSRKPGVTLDHHGGAACLSPLIFPVLIYNQLLFILLSPFLHSIGVLLVVHGSTGTCTQLVVSQEWNEAVLAPADEAQAHNSQWLMSC